MKKATHSSGCKRREEAIKDAFEYILNEVHLHPDDSTVDIANEAFTGLNFKAAWGGNAKPVIVEKTGKQLTYAKENEEPQCVYECYPITIKFYRKGVAYWIGSHFCGNHANDSEIGKILLEWRENEEPCADE